MAEVGTEMTRFSSYSLHRPEIHDSLIAGDVVLSRAMEASIVTFRAGERIPRADDGGGKIYRVCAGWLCHSRSLPDGRRQIIGLHLPNELVGLKTMVYADEPDALHALSPTALGSLDHGALWELTGRQPSVAARVIWQLAEDQRRLNNRVGALGRCSAEQRLAGFLVDVRTRLRRIGLASRDSFSLPMTQQAIADYLGLTVVHINRVIRRLREADVAMVTRGKVVIANLSELQRLALPALDPQTDVAGELRVPPVVSENGLVSGPLTTHGRDQRA
jgi:CRP-like cAMP-binding protein